MCPLNTPIQCRLFVIINKVSCFKFHLKFYNVIHFHISILIKLLITMKYIYIYVNFLQCQ